MSEIVRLPTLAGFGCGAVVALKSGGPPMTVREAIRGVAGASVRCDWLGDDGGLYSETFPVAMLTRAEPLEPDEG